MFCLFLLKSRASHRLCRLLPNISLRTNTLVHGEINCGIYRFPSPISYTTLGDVFAVRLFSALVYTGYVPSVLAGSAMCVCVKLFNCLQNNNSKTLLRPPHDRMMKFIRYFSHGPFVSIRRHRCVCCALICMYVYCTPSPHLPEKIAGRWSIDVPKRLWFPGIRPNKFTASFKNVYWPRGSAVWVPFDRIGPASRRGAKESTHNALTKAT